LGYEGVPAVDNFFYSHSYSMLYGEPFTHTGVLAEYPLGGLVTAYGGWTAGWDTGFTKNGGSTFLGGLSLQLTEKMSLTYASTVGDFGYDDAVAGSGSDSNGYSHSIVLDWDVTERLKYILQSDYVDNQLYVANLPILRLNVNQTLNGAGIIRSLNQYLLYTLNPCWGFGFRAEWLQAGGYDIGELTAGLNWRPHANVVIRPEVRFDYFEGGLQRDYGVEDSTMFGVDAIFTF
jgi:hypothetical protein